jgi:hypothetical protein
MDIVATTERAEGLVRQLLTNSELVEMGKAFIDQMPIGLYADAFYLQKIEGELAFHFKKLGPISDYNRYKVGVEFNHSPELVMAITNTSLLMSTEKLRQCINNEYVKELNYSENVKFQKKINEEISYYIKTNLPMFTRLIKENVIIYSGMELMVTYLFLYNVAIEHLAEKWENEFQQYFQDINELNLDRAIERYCSIDTVVHRDSVSFGKFIYYLIRHGKFANNDRNYFTCWEIAFPKLNHVLENKKFSNFTNRLKTSTTNSQIKFSINDVDLMDGLEFEKFIAELFSKMGYESEITKASGDQGIDVIASKNGKTIGIQAKCYSSTVGNSAIQEVVAGKAHYRLHKAIVVTNNFFTDSAQQLAKSNSIILWDRHILKEKIDENFNSSMN